MSMLNKKTIEDINVFGKKVLVRCDFNVPLKDGVITDENRLNGAMPTIKYLVDNGAKVILCSHLGKPKGEAKSELSLAPVAKRLSEMLGKKVIFAADENVVGENAKEAVAKMENTDVVLLENTRYRKEETKNEENFSKELASLADILLLGSRFGSLTTATFCVLLSLVIALDSVVGCAWVSGDFWQALNAKAKPNTAMSDDFLCDDWMVNTDDRG